MRISDWSSDVCSSDRLAAGETDHVEPDGRRPDERRHIGGNPAPFEQAKIFAERRPVGIGDALPGEPGLDPRLQRGRQWPHRHAFAQHFQGDALTDIALARSEEHTSELQSLMRISYAVFCLKKKTKQKYYYNII